MRGCFGNLERNRGLEDCSTAIGRRVRLRGSGRKTGYNPGQQFTGHSSLVTCHYLWRGGRAVECTGLENRKARKGLVSSNLTPSANTQVLPIPERIAIIGSGGSPNRHGFELNRFYLRQSATFR